MARARDDVGVFFSNYPQFDYNPTNEVWSEYRRLVKQSGWAPRSKPENAANASFRAALVKQFGTLFGTDASRLETLQRLCEKLQVDPVPASITACKRAIKSIHVNIVDFVDSERTGQPVQKFASVAKLAQYTWQNGKIIRKSEAKSSALLRFLLRPLTH